MKGNKRIGIIDVGSNSIRLVIFEINPDNSFYPIEDIKETVRLGDGVNAMGYLKEDKIKLGFDTLVLFNEICKKNRVDKIIAFGTAALRIAKNGDKFIRIVKKATDIDIEIFSGEEEAYFSFNGAINTLEIEEGVAIDLGGSSLEIVYFKNREPKDRISLSFGSVTLSEIADLKNELKKKDEDVLRKFIGEELKKVWWYKELEGLPLIGIGGTVRNIANIHLKKNDYPYDMLHNYRLSLDGVTEVVDYLKNKTYKEKIDVEGLSKARADVFIGAAITVEELMKEFSLKELIISGAGVREGVLYKKLNEYGKNIADVFMTSFEDILKFHNIDKKEKEKIYENFLKIYQSLKGYYRYSEINEKVMKIITYMEDIGKEINYINYPMHSAYMVLNLGLKGIEQKDIITSALTLVRGGDKYRIFLGYKKLFTDEEIENIKMISKILNISIIFQNILSLTKDCFDIQVTNEEIIFLVKDNKELDIAMVNLFISEKKFINTFDRKLKFEL